jgi:hypothetical protein
MAMERPFLTLIFLTFIFLTLVNLPPGPERLFAVRRTSFSERSLGKGLPSIRAAFSSHKYRNEANGSN